MAVRHNRMLRPAVKNSSTGWSGPSGWARITTAHASLPRSTAFAGSTVGDVSCGRWTVTAGEQFVCSISIRHTAAMSGNTNVDWYSGGVYLSTSAGATIVAGAGTTARYSTPVVTAPATADEGVITVNGIDGATEITAGLAEPTTTLGESFFDGDTTGAVWDGTNGSSTSTLTVSTPVVATVDFGAVTIAATGTRTSTGSAAITFGELQIATGLIVTATYDDRRGRIRIDGVNAAAGAVRAVVYSRPLGTSRYAEVRGGRVAIINHDFVRTVDDYEFRAGSGMEYKIIVLSSAENSPDVIVQQRIVTLDDTLDRVWVKFIAAPHSNRKVKLLGWSEVGRETRNAIFQVLNRVTPVAVTDVHGSRTMTVELLTSTVADRDALDTALGQGAPIFFQTPDSITCPTMYAVVGNYSWRRAASRSQRSVFTVALTEVSAPPSSIVGTGVTWATVLTGYASWDDVTDDVSTWAELMA